MNTLYQLLQLRSYAEVRTIATHLQIRKRGQNQKNIWIQEIHDLWHTSPLPTFQRLSDDAQAAALLLAQAHSVPALLWFAQYGDARPAQAPRTKKEKPPWIEPRNVSEELLYSGLLFFENQNGHTNTNRLTLPHDLREKLQSGKGAKGQSDHVQPYDSATLQLCNPATLLHDLAHYLCYLQAETDLTLMHGRWLSPTRLAELNQRLLQPDSASTHKQSHWQSLLAFLAEAAGFHVQGRLTAQGWDWLRLPAQDQLVQLCQAWQNAAPEIVQAYGQPGSGLSTPWPRPLVEQLAQIQQPFTPAQLTYRILGSYPELNGYFLAYLGDISTLVMAVTETLDALLARFRLITTPPQ